jgi:hypothetical protein
MGAEFIFNCKFPSLLVILLTKKFFTLKGCGHLPHPHTRGPSILDYPRLLIEHKPISSSPRYLRAVFFMRNLKFHHALMTMDPLAGLHSFNGRNLVRISTENLKLQTHVHAYLAIMPV